MGKDKYKTKQQLINEDELVELHQRIANLEAKETENKQVEDWLRLLKEAVDSLPIGITISDAEGKIVYSNLAEAEIHGYTVEDLIGRDARKLAPPELWKPLTFEQLYGMGVWRRDSINIRKNGEEFPVQLTSIAVEDTKGIPIGIITACEDITERKQAAETLQKSQKELKKRVKELEDFYNMAVDRELRMIELKKEIESLKAERSKYKKDNSLAG